MRVSSLAYHVWLGRFNNNSNTLLNVLATRNLLRAQGKPIGSPPPTPPPPLEHRP